MSRLYDALKEATRFREEATGTAGERVWEALGINEVEGTPSVADGKTVVTAPAAIVVGETPVASPEETSVYVPQEQLASLGHPARTHLDAAARLIPNATDPVVVERYRMLRTKIIQERENKFFKSLVIASASPQEGKTVTVLNLALSFAMLPFFKVLVVDGDMRRGTLGQWLGIDDNQLGLSNLLDGSAQLEDVVLRPDDLPIHVIPRGNSLVPDLQSSHFTSHFQRMAERFDLVLVDSPPANAITDVQLLAANCDAVLLVARAFSTSRKALEQAAQNLKRFRVIGTVLNAGSNQRPAGYDGYY